MKNSKFVIDKLAKLLEQGIVSSKDLTTELISILKNFALAGGFLFLVINGSKKFSLDNKLK